MNLISYFLGIWRRSPNLSAILCKGVCLLLCWSSLLIFAGESLADTVLPTSEPSEIIAPAIAPKLSASDISSEKVKQFVKVYLQIVDLIDQREIDLQRVETESESVQMQRQIRLEAFTLIEQAGLTRQEYGQLLGLANSDTDFRDRILAQVEETTLQE
ncbi:MAG: DUF4168 domain-containing protein [Cyanobacteria bacterium J06635_15]